MVTFLNDLTSHQKLAVESDADSRVVVAGPGSGKTRTLIAAVRHAIEVEKTPPEHICVITYTNAAADEIARRVIESESEGPFQGSSGLGFCGTLHALCLRLCQEHYALAGLPATISVLDEAQLESIMETVSLEMGVKVPISTKVLPLLSRPDLIEARPGVSRSAPELVAVETHRRLRRAGLVTFDGLLYYGLKVINQLDCPGRYETMDKPGTPVAMPHLWLFTHAFIDEAQDSAQMDWEIYDAMPCFRQFIVGDGDQSIYGFRGAAVHNFNAAADPAEVGKEVFFLETNWRSGHRICNVAQQLIERNKNRIQKATIAAKSGGEVVDVMCENSASELVTVCSAISEYWAPYNETAVLARTNWLANEVAQFLAGKGIPVAKRTLPVVPDDWSRAKALLTALANPFSDFAVLQYLRLLDKTNAAKVKNEAAKEMKSVNALLGMEFGDGNGFDDAALLRHNVSLAGRDRIHAAAHELNNSKPGWSLNDLLLNLRAQEQSAGDVDGEGVYVGTIHSAKGREWHTVFIVGCEEGLLPSSKAGTDIEEERRLMYVAITRAKERVLFTWCKERPQRRGPGAPPGPMEPKTRSRFLTEAGL